jgi:hypothetical protein
MASLNYKIKGRARELADLAKGQPGALRNKKTSQKPIIHSCTDHSL